MTEQREVSQWVEDVWIEAPGLAVIVITNECGCSYIFHVEPEGDGFISTGTADPFCPRCKREFWQLQERAMFAGAGALLSSVSTPVAVFEQE